MLRVEGLGIADVPGAFVTRPLESFVLTYAGLEGDRHAGLTMKAGSRQKHLPKGVELRNARQLSLVAVEELARIAEVLALPRVDFTWLGANLLLSGLPELTQLAPSTRLLFPSGAVIVVDGDNAPCTKAGRAVAEGAKVSDAGLPSRFVKAAWKRRGLVGWVERPGLVRVSDPVTLVSR
jgi:MOSC domain-containing protein YiiM